RAGRDHEQGGRTRPGHRRPGRVRRRGGREGQPAGQRPAGAEQHLGEGGFRGGGRGLQRPAADSQEASREGILVTPLSEPKPALLLAAHGTRDQAGVDAFAALAERVGKLAAADGTRVAGGFIELSAPALRDAVADLAAASPGPPAAAGGNASPAAAGGNASPAAAGGNASPAAAGGNASM